MTLRSTLAAPLQQEDGYQIIAAVGEASQLAPLLALSTALARAHEGEVTLVTVTPDGHQPDWLSAPETVNGVPVNIVVRLGRSAAGAILAIVRDDPPDLLLLGWRGSPGGGRYILGSTLDPLIDKAPCNIAVLRTTDETGPIGHELEHIERVLIPVAGGPNAALAIDLALDLVPRVHITALNIAPISRGRAGVHIGRERLETALKPWKEHAHSERIEPKVVQAPGVIGGILNEARKGYDLLLVGASHESYIDRVLFGNVPQTVAMESPIPTMVIKRLAAPTEYVPSRLKRWLVNALPRLTVSEQVEAYRTIRRSARPDVDFFLMMGLSATIASLGLLLNSPAVIIGAMLVAPLMSAVAGIGLGVVQGDWRMLRLAIDATVRGMLLSILVGLVITWIVPDARANNEILVRTYPSLLDLGIALASGVAGAYALCRKELSASLPGVAIAAALVPPLAVVGIGVALRDGSVAGGALLLFLTNLVAISAAGGLVFLWLGFRPDWGVESRARVFKGGVISTALLLMAVSLPLGWLTVNSLSSAALNRTIQAVLAEEIGDMHRVELVAWEKRAPVLEEAVTDVETIHLEVQVRAVRTISHGEAVELQKSVAGRLQRPVALVLTVIPITQLDPIVPPTLTPTATPTRTAAHTPTVTPTRVPTYTPLPSSTPSPTPAPTLNPTPPPARIGDTDGLGLNLREAPGGEVIDILPEGTPVEILQRQQVDDQAWLQVRDPQGRTGWVAAQFVQLP
jgi:uncharacterized hydrophobic protein (TIGR00271 family)